MFVLPLQSGLVNQGYETAKSAVQAVQSVTGNISGGLGSIGAAIASIFILVHIFACMSAILEGGKFQIKMLGPIVIYVLICNFFLVSTPTTTFFSALQEGVATEINVAYNSMFSIVDDNGNVTQQSRVDYFIEKYRENNAARLAQIDQALEQAKQDYNRDIEGMFSESDPESEEVNTANKGFIKKNLQNLGNSLKRTLEEWWNNIKLMFVKSFYKIEKNVESSYLNIILSIGVAFLFLVVLDFLVGVLALMMTSMGGILFGIAIVFGPITWAFGLLPGNSGVIKSWFIRICQYALYGPLCHLVSYFCMVVLSKFIGNMAAVSGFIALTLCNLVLLTAIPSIASWIIEGAAGGISLSQGLQTLASPMRLMSEASNVMEARRDTEQKNIGQQQLDALREISGKLGGSVGGGPSASAGSPEGITPE